jgi:hypothetical protein
MSRIEDYHRLHPPAIGNIDNRAFILGSPDHPLERSRIWVADGQNPLGNDVGSEAHM